MGAALAIAAKDLRQLVRDRAGMFWVLAFPLVVSVLFGSIFSDDGDGARPIHVAVADEDHTAASARMIERLEQSASLEVEQMSAGAAADAVRKGDVAAYLRFGPGYGHSDRFLPVDPGAVELGTDPSRRATAAMLQGLLMEALYDEMKQLLADPDAMQAAVHRLVARLADGPDAAPALALLQPLEGLVAGADLSRLRQELSFATPKLVSVARSASGRPRTSYDITFPQSTGWALIAIISFFATVIARERESGNLMRLRLAPISMTHIVAGKGVAALVASIAIMLLVLVVGIAGFGLRVDSYPLLGLALFCASFSAAGLILLFSTLGKTAQAVEGASWTVMIPLFMAGGGMLPLIFMPAWLQQVSNFSPLKWNLYAIEGAIWRGFSLSEMLLPCGILIAIGLAAFSFGGMILARTRG